MNDKIKKLIKFARKRGDTFYLEALLNIEAFIVVENYQNLYSTCEN